MLNNEKTIRFEDFAAVSQDEMFWERCCTIHFPAS